MIIRDKDDIESIENMLKSMRYKVMKATDIQIQNRQMAGLIELLEEYNYKLKHIIITKNGL